MKIKEACLVEENIFAGFLPFARPKPSVAIIPFTVFRGSISSCSFSKEYLGKSCEKNKIWNTVLKVCPFTQASATNDLVQKKLVYLYICDQAESIKELTVMMMFVAVSRVSE